MVVGGMIRVGGPRGGRVVDGSLLADPVGGSDDAGSSAMFRGRIRIGFRSQVRTNLWKHSLLRCDADGAIFARVLRL